MILDGPLNIRRYMLYPVLLAVLLLLGIVYIGVYQYWQQQQQFFTQTVEQNIAANFKMIQDNEANTLQGFLDFIGDNSTLQQAWLAQDRTALLAVSAPIYSALNANHAISHFYFHQLDGQNFLRVHQPQQFDDYSSRSTLSQAQRTKKTVVGIESATNASVVLCVVKPWFIAGQLVGYLELGEEIAQLLNQLEQDSNTKLLLAVDKSSLNDQAITDKTAHYPATKDMIELDDIVVYQREQVKVYEKILQFIQSRQRQGMVLISSGYHLLISSVPWQADNLTGKLYFQIDITALLQRDRQLFWSIFLLLSVLGIVAISFYGWLSLVVQRRFAIGYRQLKTKELQRKQANSQLEQSNKALTALLAEQNKNLQSSELRYSTLFERSTDALLIIDGQQFVDCNQATLELLGYERKEEIYNIHPSKLSPEYQPDGRLSSEKADEMIALAFGQGSHRFEWDHQRKNGEVFPVEVLLTDIPEGDKHLLHVVWRDISERKRAEQEITHRAYYDTVTGLPNRQLMIDRLEQLFHEGQRHGYFHAVLFMDLDRFKTINDSLGHSVGDAVLIEVAKRISSCVREEDTAARFGGDEFVVLLRKLGSNMDDALAHAEQIADKIQKAMKMPMFISEQQLYNTVSIGINLFPTMENGIEDVLKHADAAMYNAKESGRNCISTYLHDMHEKVLKRLMLEKDLRQAVKQETIKVYYQPQVNGDGVIISVEALVRWQHPAYGFVAPDEFIAIAEESGIIYELGNLVLNRAVSDISLLENRLNMHLGLSVNISPRQLQQPDLFEQIYNIIQRYQLRAGFLTLETTEGVIIENFDAITTKLMSLKQLGVRLSLDDFGTGYSSLSYLKRLPIDELKIDRSFIADIIADADDALLVSTIINIAQQFNFSVVCEGVESDEQFDFLNAKHCDLYQGFLFSKPLPLDQLAAFIRQQ